MKKIILFLLLPMVLLACRGPRCYIAMTGPQYPPYEGHVKIFYEKPTDVEYEEIGVVSAQGWSHKHVAAQFFRTMQEKAAKQGANGLIMSASAKEQDVWRFGAHFGHGGGGKFKIIELTAIAIRMK